MATTESARSHALDGLRGYAALAVVFYHAILHNDTTLIERVLFQPAQNISGLRDGLTKFALLLQHGELAVFIFFVLSGAVLRLSLDRRNNSPVLPTCISFAGARLLRLYPPLIVSLVLMYVLGRVGLDGFPKFSSEVFWWNVTLWKTWMHGPSTTLQAEVMAIPFLLIGWLLRKHFGLPGLALIFVYALLSIDFAPLVFNLPNMHAYLYAFMAGMIAAEPALRPLMRQAPPSSWWLALALLIFCKTLHPQSSMPAFIASIFCAAVLVSGLLYGQRGTLHAFLERPVSQLLGQISFSLYLLNVPMLLVIWAFTDRFAWPKSHALEAGILVGLGSLLLTVPLAMASERWIERPSIAAGRWFNRFVFARFAPKSQAPVAGVPIEIAEGAPGVMVRAEGTEVSLQ
jgi:peptidoglycan/LPS O-acetylase OafA/YrhL